ncbi:MAG TPA: M4 family metallopeptidase [Thermoanaerobaculia bacterium]|nr:M4 family metallopeptidase [Thermoanaerobaculia bacterium]
MKYRISTTLLSLFLMAAGVSAADSMKIVDRDAQGVPTFVSGSIGALPKGDRGRSAVTFLKSLVRESFGARGTEELAADRVRVDSLGKLHVRVQQRLNGLPVVGAELLLHADAATGEVYAVNGRFVPDTGLPRHPALAADKALATAYTEAGIQNPTVLEGPALTYVVDTAEGGACLAWSALVRYEDAAGEMIERIFADATIGGVAARHPRIFDVRNRETYTASNTTSLPGTLLIRETETSTDAYIQKIHDNTGKAYDYYWNRFGRDSLNGAGMTLTSSAHYDVNYNNARWTGTQMIYGDGDGTKFSPLGNALDVVAHELTHGVTQNESGLVYQNESGAINESLSDIFGAAVEVWSAGGINANTWKLGEDVYTPATAGDALRYMDNPTQDGSSKDFYADRYTGTDDFGGVHWNSGISNLAFQRLVAGGYHPRGKNRYSVSGLGINKAEAIFYRAQTEYLTSTSDFTALRNATLQAASDLFPASYERASVRMAWCMVGVYGTDCPPTNLTGSGTTFAGRRIVDITWNNYTGGSFDVFRNGTRIATTANLYYRDMFTTTATSANYWVCQAGSTTWYDSNTCSNVTTVYF